MADGIAMKLEKGAVRKSVKWGEIKLRGELTITAFSMQEGNGRGRCCLPCQLREGGQHGQRDSNLIENRSREKKFGMVVVEIKRRAKLTITALSM